MIDEWMPIETAPKDGTEVLAWREDAGVLMARYTACINFCTDSELEGLNESDQEQEDWFYADFIEGGRLDGDLIPTHWMSLPNGPSTT